MHSESSELPLNPHSEDALSLFGAEAAGSKTTASAPTSVPDTVVRETLRTSSSHDAAPLVHSATPLAVHVGAASAARSGAVDAALQDLPGAVPLSRLLDAAPLRFVDGVAVVQALSAAAQGKGGRKAAMPDLSGVFLKDSGEVVALGGNTGEPAARELARLLHRLVPSESTPPVGRLFIDRWTSGASTDLGEFSSELGYFARPNGRELLSSIYSKCAALPDAPSSAALAAVSPTAPAAIAQVTPPPIPVSEPPRREQPPAVSWLKSHRRQIVFATAMTVAAIVATGFAAWFWPSATTTAASTEKPPQTLSAQPEATERGAAGEKQKPNQPAAAAVRRTSTQSATRGTRRAVPALANAGALDVAATTAAVPPSAAPRVSGQAVPANVEPPSRGVPDLRIYSESDAGVQPPKLRSAELPELLIAGFPTKTNAVELIVGERGDVERVRMLGAPQRIPDIMLLSRLKEWLFEPALKDGAAVRYRLVLTWNVTP